MMTTMTILEMKAKERSMIARKQISTTWLLERRKPWKKEWLTAPKTRSPPCPGAERKVQSWTERAKVWS